MKNLSVAILLVFATSLALVSCKGSQNQGDLKDSNDGNSSTCEVQAKVVDYTGLSSCSILFELEDGSFLEPVEGVDRKEMLKAETVKISYTKMPNMMSSCMKGKLVNITCFEVIKKGTPTKGKID